MRGARPSIVSARPRRALAGLVLAAAVVLQSSRDPRSFGSVPFLGLPGDIALCGRSYEGQRGSTRTAEDVSAGGGTPLVVEPWFHAPCLPGACTAVAADTPCHTVIYVSAGPGRLVGYYAEGPPVGRLSRRLPRAVAIIDASRIEAYHPRIPDRPAQRSDSARYPARTRLPPPFTLS